MAPLLLRLVAAASCLAATPISAATATATATATAHHPDLDAAHDHAFALFNSIHSAMRQWGSSVHHNGMSFFLAHAPAGSVFYRGDRTPHRPQSFEWLAFEFEHAGIFARSWEPSAARKQSDHHGIDRVLLSHQASHRPMPPAVQPNVLADHASSQHPLPIITDDDRQQEPPSPPDWNRAFRGYLQMYRANRPLNLLYIDGQAAAKCKLGPMDSQDLILLDWDYDSGDKQRKDFGGEVARGTEMCALADEWVFEAGGKIDGFIRMEAGFEIIFCDYSPAGGLDLVSAQATPFRNESGYDPNGDDDDDDGPSSAAVTQAFEWMRAASARFHGHPAGRLDVDWSSMVSAFAYPVNLTNPDPTRQDLPRLVNVTRQDRRNIRSRLRQVLTERGGRDSADKGVVNWQGLVDKIVTRFSPRLAYLASTEPLAQEMLAAIATLIDPFVDYLDQSPTARQAGIARCVQHYLDPTLLHRQAWTPEDESIAASVETVSSAICSALFAAQQVLRSNETTAHGARSALARARAIVQQLNERLRWTTWKECGACQGNEVCSIPMFPMGGMDDHLNPRCKNFTAIWQNRGYWGLGR